ncbi:bifunctional [glutamine synthetase] adenylyltransferase/[glutamine synthetase]-adenylyl-L-tyrosine phosphorylase [Amorphus orientalis]|uniref:Bifunctional glutamine synthetase adenylyltransferase/adenylyl-removing enzyme n=1 Tax=Amorphus orientalis TaxID=649198 RepID=A0AAE3VN26_9HYPH|nr:bifunctional [glutamine synthetase] adenylyltransferase/[glutamine synthetase]-adenylyl-L-tyrosine phosphorylase [Amorphus orientalis]MDQ0315139.1 glutamate-ammonia-ligase adenylyltransferase [Amorphus orientalis]
MTSDKNDETAPLHSRLAVKIPADPDRADAVTSEIDKAAAEEGAGLAGLIEASPELRPFLVGVFSNSPFLKDLGLRDPARLARLLGEAPERSLEALIERLAQPAADEASLMTDLRKAKQEAALLIALADLGGVWQLETVTDSLATFADAALSAAVCFLLKEQHDRGKLKLADPDRPEHDSGYIVLGMGKYGAHELNYSSDIDLIVFFDPDRAPLADPDDAAQLFVRLTRRLVHILQERTGDGYVFRTDLRLRPDPGATAVALSVPAALHYYESLGQNWERAALIKARPAAGDIPAGEALLKDISPFVWRRSFDYATIADVHSIKRQIHAAKGHGRIAVAGHNIKLGRGGIREIEFFVQTQQLIAGGRNPELRGLQTLKMLAELHRAHWIDEATREELDEAYKFLRFVEHRLQMIHDEQTHTLPSGDEGLAPVARLAGFAALEEFKSGLRQRLERVQGHYAQLFENEPTLSGTLGNLVFTGDDDDPETLDTLSRLGYQRPQEVTRAIRAWHFGRYPATRSSRSRELLTELVPMILDALAHTENADVAFNAFDRFVSHLPAGVQIFSLLKSNPSLLGLLATIMGAAPKLAQTLTRRPRVLDAVLDPTFFGALPGADETHALLERSLAEARTYEDALDLARIFGQEQVFLVSVRVLTGTMSPSDAGNAYARIADVLVDELFKRAADAFAETHGQVPGGRVAVLALGKLGGGEMTAASDLDLILLYDHDPDADSSDGRKPLAPSQYYTRLTQRLVSALSAPTAEGTLYEVDFRLRPSGNAGPLATRLSSFEAYQAKDAWTWEHMALTRARAIGGDPDLQDRVGRIIGDVLSRERDRESLRTDVLEMRRRLEKEKGTKDIWDLKQVAGGLVDLEFIAQFVQLSHAHVHPEVLSANTETVLREASTCGLLDRTAAETLLPAARLYQALTQILRLAVDGAFNPEAAPKGVRDLLARAGDAPDFSRLEAELTDMQAAVRATFERVIGEV